MGRRNLLGLDIDGSAVRMIRLRKDGTGYTVTNAGISDIVPWGDDPALRRIHTNRASVGGLASCGIARRGGFEIRPYVVCGLRGPEVVVRDFEFPALPAEEIGPAVELEASQICPFSTEESTLDYQVTSNTDKKTVGFWVAAANGLIENTRQFVHEAVLRCALIDVAGLALLNLLETTGQDEAPGVAAGGRCGQDGHRGREAGPAPSTMSISSLPSTKPTAPRVPQAPPLPRSAVLDVGDSCTTIAIMDPAGRPFVRDIHCGSQEILRRVALDTGLSKFESRNSNFEFGSLERACRDLTEDIATTLRYYAAQHGSGRVDRLLVSGGFAAVREFIELLGTNLYVEVEPWNPVGQMRCEAGSECESLLQKAGPSLAVAAGLAMRHI